MFFVGWKVSLGVNNWVLKSGRWFGCVWIVFGWCYFDIRIGWIINGWKWKVLY